MSLLNDVMRDLQTRGVPGVPPLSGLAPVADVPSQYRRRGLLLPALAAVLVVAAISLSRPVADGGWVSPFTRIMGGAATEPQDAGIPTDAQTSPQFEPALAATGENLRDLFDIDRSADAGLARRDNIAGDPAMNATPELAALAEPPAAESRLPIVAEPQATAGAPARKATLRIAPGIDRPDVIVAQGLKAMRGNDLFAAERMFREALAVESGDVDTWSYLYSVLARRSQAAAAEQALQQGLIAADEPAELAKLYARMLLDRGEKDAAVSILKIHRPPAASDIEYDSFLAALLQQQGQYADAGEIYATLLRVDPGSGSLWTGLAMSHDSLGKRGDALAAFERALTSGSLKTPLARYARRRVTELRADD